MLNNELLDFSADEQKLSMLLVISPNC